MYVCELNTNVTSSVKTDTVVCLNNRDVLHLLREVHTKTSLMYTSRAHQEFFGGVDIFVYTKSEAVSP